jgi:hypothetical protein
MQYLKKKKTEISWVLLAYAWNPRYEAEIRIAIRGHFGQIVWEPPISKIARLKWIGGVAQAVECLCSFLASLSS